MKAIVSSATKPARIWSLADLELLDDMPVPVMVFMSGAYGRHTLNNPTDPGFRVLHQNDLFTSHFGHARSPGAYKQYVASLPHTLRLARQDYIADLLRGNTLHNGRVDLQVLAPMFDGMGKSSSEFVSGADSKAIRVETSPGHVESAVMLLVDMESASAEMRLSAIARRYPLHTIMFAQDGSLLIANRAALEAFQLNASGSEGHSQEPMTLQRLFELGAYPGGAAEAQAALHEACHAIFDLKVSCHRHTQPRRKGATRRWEMIEMWPLTDPVTSCPAVLVAQYNITQQKELELKLSVSEAALQRHNQKLEQDTIAILEEKLQLQRQAESLVHRLDVVLHNKFESTKMAFDADTPIDKTLSYLQGIIKGELPPVEVALDLYNILSKSDTDLRQPVGLETQLLKDNDMDSDVAKSMLQLLKGHTAAAKPSTLHQSISSQRLELAVPMSSGYPQAPMQSSAEVFVPAPVTTVVERMLKDAENNWQFDIFSYADATPGISLSLLAFHLMNVTGLMKSFGIDAIRLSNFLQRIEAGYDPANPYHNSIHVASVVQVTHMILCHGGLLQSGAMNVHQHIASMWSAVMHDFEHGGVNNDFLIKTSAPLAVLYNDQSPLENHHLAASTALFGQDRYRFLPVKEVMGERVRSVRVSCINQVLGTDMKKHFDIVSRFQASFNRPGAVGAPVGAVGAPVGGHGSRASGIDWATLKNEDKALVDQMVLKCADIGHLAAATQTHRRWAFQLEEEFYRQGDRERALKLPVSPLMDRTQQGGMTRSQLGFFSIVGMPLFKAMTDLFDGCQPLLDGVLANFRAWEKAAEVTDVSK